MKRFCEQTNMNVFKSSQRLLFQASICVAMALSALGLTSCADPVTYAYLAVQISIDPVTVSDDLRKTIASCTLVVQGDDEDFVALPCTFNQTPYNLGVAEFSTNKRRGQLVFVAIMRDLNQAVVAQGMSPPVAIVPGMTATSIVAVAVNPPMPGSDASTVDTAMPAVNVDAGGDTL